MVASVNTEGVLSSSKEDVEVHEVLELATQVPTLAVNIFLIVGRDDVNFLPERSESDAQVVDNNSQAASLGPGTELWRSHDNCSHFRFVQKACQVLAERKFFSQLGVFL